MNYQADYIYTISENNKLFTVYLLPYTNGTFPSVVIRSPYVDSFETWNENDIVINYLNEYREWLKNGYAVIIQHCRGRGKSEGDCIPYINERNDSISLLEWVRKQSFYNGEIFLEGCSYTTSVWYATAPFSKDIKGAIFGMQDSERYNICYRKGFMKKGLHGNWYVDMYKAKSHIKKNFTTTTFDMLPLKNFTRIVFGECSEDFDDMLKSPNPSDAFWQTHNGGTDARRATDNIKFPVLFTTAFNDIYTGGLFDMWNQMSEESRKQCAMVVSPCNHGDFIDDYDSTIEFPNGRIIEQFGKNYEIEWLNYIREQDSKSPFEQGKITYFRLFDNKWATDEFYNATGTVEIKLGNEMISYVYNPFDAPKFKGGLSRTFGGSFFQDKPNSRYDIISVYTKPFEKEVFVKGRMTARLRVKSDCEDTCFYMRISIEKEQGDFGLRDDITSLCYQLGDYTPNAFVDLDFLFDEHAFLIKKGERLRIDISSADNEHYVRHTNNKGLYSEQGTAKIAKNTVDLSSSILTLNIE